MLGGKGVEHELRHRIHAARPMAIRTKLGDEEAQSPHVGRPDDLAREARKLAPVDAGSMVVIHTSFIDHVLPYGRNPR